MEYLEINAHIDLHEFFFNLPKVLLSFVDLGPISLTISPWLWLKADMQILFHYDSIFGCYIPAEVCTCHNNTTVVSYANLREKRDFPKNFITMEPKDLTMALTSKSGLTSC